MPALDDRASEGGRNSGLSLMPALPRNGHRARSLKRRPHYESRNVSYSNGSARIPSRSLAIQRLHWTATVRLLPSPIRASELASTFLWRKKRIATYRVPTSGGSIEAPSKAQFLQPTFEDNAIVLPTVQDPPLAPGAYSVNSPIVAWEITIALDGGEVTEVGEYRGGAQHDGQSFHVFVRRRL